MLSLKAEDAIKSWSACAGTAMRSPIMSPGSKATMRARAVPDTPDCK